MIRSQKVDQYIERFSGEKKEKLNELRRLMEDYIPDVEEKISYAMPTYALKENILHFAAHHLHFGFYPGPEAIEAFKNEVEPYETSKGAIKFPYGKPLPLELILKIILFNVKASREKKRSNNVIPFTGGE